MVFVTSSLEKFREIEFLSIVKFIRIVFLPKGAGNNKILTLLKVKILALAASPRGQEFFTIPRVRIFFYLQAGKNFILALPLGQEQYSLIFMDFFLPVANL